MDVQGAFLLVIGFGVLMKRLALANVVAAEGWLRALGVAPREESHIWSGVTLIAGLALVCAGVLRFIA
jgi:hypothetical protein